MKMKFNNKYFRWGLTAFIVIAASICFYYLMFHNSDLIAGVKVISNILMPVVFGLVMAYLLTPVLNHLEHYVLNPFCDLIKIKRSKKRKSIVRGIGVITTVFLAFALIYALCAMLLSQIIPSIVNIVSNFDTYINNLYVWMNKMLADNPELGDQALHLLDEYSDELKDWLNDIVFNKSSEMIKTVSLSAINVLKVLMNFVIGLIISIYVLSSKEKFAGQFKKLTYAAFDKKSANVIINNFRFTHKTFIGFISGKILDSLIIGILCFIGTSLMRTPYALLVSVVIGVTNVIPFFGPYLGAIPSAILILIVDLSHPLNCLYFVIFILILQQVDGNIIGPKILGSSTGLTGFWVIFAITLFGGLFGIIGMIIGVPVFAVIYAAVKSFVCTALEKKEMPKDTELYIKLGAADEKGFHEFTPEYKLKKEDRDKTPYGSRFISNLDADILEEEAKQPDRDGTNCEKNNKTVEEQPRQVNNDALNPQGPKPSRHASKE